MDSYDINKFLEILYSCQNTYINNTQPQNYNLGKVKLREQILLSVSWGPLGNLSQRSRRLNLEFDLKKLLKGLNV